MPSPSCPRASLPMAQVRLRQREPGSGSWVAAAAERLLLRICGWGAARGASVSLEAGGLLRMGVPLHLAVNSA